VPRRVNVDDLLDARGVAELLGLSHPNTVSVYQRRYDDMPKPAVDLGKGRVKLWLKPELETWARERSRDRGRPRGDR
jgi:predicted DNA-binding transcriptional regulator AlpA